MFTDTVNSAALKARIGSEAYRKIKARQDALVRQALIASPSGVALQDTGDGYFFSFGSIGHAITAALMFQWLMAHERWPETYTARVGLHLGEVEQGVSEVTGQADFVSSAIDLASRTMSLALGGQILLTRSVFDAAREVVRQHPTPGPGISAPPLKWMSHGHYVFNGISEPIEVFEVGAEPNAPLVPPPESEKAKRYACRDAINKDKGWGGLDEEELRRVELLFCPPMLRHTQKSPEIEPLSRAGYMLGKILEEVSNLNALRSPQARRAILRNKYLAEMLEEQPSFISKLLQGRSGNQKRDRELWSKCRRLFCLLMLGTEHAKLRAAPATEIETISRRMEGYFFGPHSCVVGPYFLGDTLGIPQSSNEGAYHLLWLGMEALMGGSTLHLTVASGGHLFQFAHNGSLTPLGEGALCAALCGVKFRFVFPKLAVSIAAAESAEDVIRLMHERQRSGASYPTLKAMAAICSRETPSCDAGLIDCA